MIKLQVNIDAREASDLILAIHETFPGGELSELKDTLTRFYNFVTYGNTTGMLPLVSEEE